GGKQVWRDHYVHGGWRVFIYLPTWTIAACGLILVFGHNLLDPLAQQPWGSNLLWKLIHVNGYVPTRPIATIVAYPLIPWPGVMMLGYCFGRILQFPIQNRNRACVAIGVVSILIFLALRCTNAYGDSNHWEVQESGRLFHLWSFLNTTKYPPSLLFLLMTLGPAILILPILDRLPDRLAGWLETFGRVPFFYYILHWFLIRTVSWIWIKWQFDSTQNLIFTSPNTWPEAYEPNLGRVYLAWLVLIVVLYPVCRWYAGFKSQHRHWQALSYL
ncbi:MAG: heparan-alpha-glucosaminide N-acetyltransferase domain-containing protein, partial [Planctomycetota bacterium]